MTAASSDEPVEAVAGEDFDGDGFRDVAVVRSGVVGATIDAQTRLKGVVEVRRGSDATLLWSRSMNGLIRPLPGAVLMFELVDATVTREPTETRYDYVWQLARLNGSDGSVVWSKNTASSFTSRHADGTWTGFPQGIRMVPDATGDGAEDVLFTNADAASTPAPYSPEAVVVTGHLLDGTSGAEQGRTVSAGIDMDTPFGGHSAVFDYLPAIIPTEDLNGDGLGDVLAISGVHGQEVLLSAHAATGSLPYWTAPISNSPATAALIAPIPARLNADDTPDFIVRGTRSLRGLPRPDLARIGYYGETLTGVDGRTGEILWYWTVSGGGFLPGGDIDGDGMTDVRAYEFLDYSTIALRAISGATGFTIFGPYNFAPGGNSVTYVCVCGDDITGDDSHETLLAYATYAPAPDFSVVVSAAVALDGSSGALVWHAPLHPSLADAPQFAGADADGDGKRDLYSAAAVEDGGAGRAVGSVRKGVDYGLVWEHATPVRAGTFYWISSHTADLSAAQGPEIVATVYPYVVHMSGDMGYIEPQPPSAAAFSATGTLWTF